MDSLPDELVISIFRVACGRPPRLASDQSGDSPRSDAWFDTWLGGETGAAFASRTGRDTLGCLRLTSRRMARLAADPSLWPTAVMRTDGGSEAVGVPDHVLANLRDIGVKGLKPLPDLAVLALRCPRLQVMTWLPPLWNGDGAAAMIGPLA